MGYMEFDIIRIVPPEIYFSNSVTLKNITALRTKYNKVTHDNSNVCKNA